MIDLSTLKLDNLVVTEMKHNMTYTFAQEYNDPQNYYWYKEGFTKAELERVYKQVESIPFQKATVIGGETSNELRSSSVKWIKQNQE